jgi:hypothetical protein
MEDGDLQTSIMAKSKKKGRHKFSKEADKKLVNMVHKHFPKGKDWAFLLEEDSTDSKPLFVHSATGK